MEAAKPEYVCTACQWEGDEPLINPHGLACPMCRGDVELPEEEPEQETGKQGAD